MTINAGSNPATTPTDPADPEKQTNTPMMQEFLPVPLTDEELIHRGTSLAEIRDEIDSLEMQKKDSAADFKAKIEMKEAESVRLARIVRTKSELRLIEVVDRPDYQNKRIDRVRTDTGEVVDSRPMNIEDIQEDMPFENRHAGKIAYLGEG